MTNRYYLTSFIGILCLLLSATLHAQEEVNDVYIPAKRYIDIKLRSQSKYNTQAKKEQQKLLKRLTRLEKRYAKKLQRKDSTGFASYRLNPLTYDSIEKIANNKEHKTAQKPIGVSTLTDTLQAIQSFVVKKIHLNDNASVFQGYDEKITAVNTDSRHTANIDNLITKRTSALQNIQSQNKGKVTGFTGIHKQVFYARQRIKTWKAISEEPSKAEEAAYEILQGQQGFDEQIASINTPGMQTLAGNAAPASELEKMGYQTKRQMQAQLQQKFGNSLSGVQQRMSSQITDYKDKLNNIQQAKNTAKSTKQSIRSVNKINTPTFKVNPMRGLPLRERIEQQYNWQTTRATIDGKPAMFQFTAMAGFKHTPTLMYGVGIGTAIGLGTSWNNIRFSFEGIGIRTFAEKQLFYGIGVYTGYERMYKQTALFNNENRTERPGNINQHNTTKYYESVLIGISKRYRINENWNGSLQVLYDVWWKEKGLKSPIQLRIATIK